MQRAALVLTAAVAAAQSPPNITAILAQMTVKQKIGQMTQLDLSMVTKAGSVFDLDPVKLQQIIGDYGVGNILNSAVGCQCTGDVCASGTSLETWRNITQTLATFALASQPNVQPAVPLLYGVDSVHGANFLDQGVWFPHNFGLAAMFRPDLVRAMSSVATMDTRSMGASWQFAPVLGLGIEPRWSRFYETPGESPFIGAAQGRAYVQGVSDASAALGLNYTLAVPTIKHYFGYSAPRTGKDRTDAWIPDPYLKQYFQPSFESALGTAQELAVGGSVMINSASINGIPATASKALLTDILRTELGCQDCVALTDWQDIEKLYLYHNQAPTMADAIVLALEAGVDMSMVPYDFSFPDTLAELVSNGTVPESRLDESVTRILTLKVQMGLFEQPAVPPQLANRPAWQQADLDLALTTARESMTLLQNGPVQGTNGKSALPLTGWLPQGARVLVVGPSAVDIVSLCGGWSLTTLAKGNGQCGYPQSKGASIGQAVTTLATNYGVSSVTVLQGVNYTSYDPSLLANVTASAQASDVVIMAVGEGPEKETAGDIQDLTLSFPQLALFAALQTAGKPIITVLVEPRPRVLSSGSIDIAGGSAAILMAYLPCFMGGQAIAETLFGLHNPSGRLPFTYPRTTGDLDAHFHKPWNGSAWEGVPDSTYHNPLFPFGWGLSYSSIRYSDLVLSPSTVAAGEAVTVSVTVTNAGPMDASEAVLMFVRQLFRPAITPEASLLKGFNNVNITAGSSVTVSITLNTTDLAYWSPGLDKQVDAGVYNISVGLPQPSASGPANGNNGLTAQLTVTNSARAVFRGPGQWEWVKIPSTLLTAGRAGSISSLEASVLDHTQSQQGAAHGKLSDAELSSLTDAVLGSGVLDGGPVAKAVREARVRDVLRAWADGQRT